MTIRHQLELHFAAWREYYGSRADEFVSDGIMSDREADWVSAPLRILFLLREAHDRKGVMKACGYDLRVAWRNIRDFKQASRKTYTACMRCAADLYEAQGFPRPADDLVLKSIAVMNIKKLSGGASAKRREIREFASREKWFLLRQMEILSPHIVLCGGTLEDWNKHVEKLTPTRNEWSFVNRGMLFLNHVHPAARGQKWPERHASILQSFRQWQR